MTYIVHFRYDVMWHLAPSLDCSIADALVLLGEKRLAGAVLKAALVWHQLLLKRQTVKNALARVLNPLV